MCLERLTKLRPFLCCLIFSVLIFISCLILLKIYPDFRLFVLQTPGQSFTLEVTAIVLGVISAFIAILIPLHYSMVLDIVQKINDSQNKNPDEIKNLKLYVAASDIIIAITAIYGITSLLAGAVAMGIHLQIIPEINNYLKMISIACLVMLCTSIARSFCLTWKKGLKRKNNNRFNCLFIVYGLTIFMGGVVSIFWARSLYYFQWPHHNAFEALIVLASFYFMWIFLKLPFIPINRVEKLSQNIT